MGRVVTAEERNRLFEEIRQYLAEELEVDASEITEQTDVINDLGGDSVIFLEIVEEFREKYGIKLEVRIIGQYMLKKSIRNIGEAVDSLCEIIEKGEDIILEQQGEEVVESERT